MLSVWPGAGDGIQAVEQCKGAHRCLVYLLEIAALPVASLGVGEQEFREAADDGQLILEVVPGALVRHRRIHPGTTTDGATLSRKVFTRSMRRQPRAASRRSSSAAHSTGRAGR